jgi:hypothetical protein
LLGSINKRGGTHGRLRIHSGLGPYVTNPF